MKAFLFSIKLYLFITVISLSFTMLSAQSDTSRWKAQIAFGVNSPDSDGFVSGFQAKSVNFPTINLGIQHMFTRTLGAKLDYGFNRFSNVDNSVEFKTNYSRINAQFVYDATSKLGFLPLGIGLVAHAGPGYSSIKPLGNFANNKHSFLNAMLGAEVHYRLNKRLSLYADASSIFSFASDKEYNPISEGYGTFNGNLFTLTFGLSVSLSGCQYCD